MISIPMNEAKIAFDRMFEFTLIDPEGNGVESNAHFESLEVRNLVFRFSGKKPLLRNISFKVQVGEIISLMGENGSGKSTIIQILQRNYAFEEGSIEINQSVLLEAISLYNWRESIAVVPQDIHIFSTTILENIAFDDAISKQNEVIAFLTEYGFIDFFNKIPQSYLTKVGDGGITLSGGQKQLIAIARALYCNPKLLILDEATASMDRESEQFVINLLKRIQAQMAIIFVTHRLHILKNLSTRIYIIESGEIDNFGTHDELMKTENLYSVYWKDLQ
jgi:ATP-binding cassette subfamily B protein